MKQETQSTLTFKEESRLAEQFVVGSYSLTFELLSMSLELFAYVLHLLSDKLQMKLPLMSLLESVIPSFLSFDYTWGLRVFFPEDFPRG